MVPKGQRRRAGAATGKRGGTSETDSPLERASQGRHEARKSASVVPPRAPVIASGTRRVKSRSSIFVEVPSTLAPYRGSKHGSFPPRQGPDRGNEHQPLGRMRATGRGRPFGYPHSKEGVPEVTSVGDGAPWRIPAKVPSSG